MLAKRATPGQVAPLFALMMVVVLGLVGLAVDVVHARSVGEDAQRAADAGALAGVAYLPGAIATAQSQGDALSKANGFNDTDTVTAPANRTSSCSAAIYAGAGTTCIRYNVNGPNRTLQETITTHVATSFLKILGFSYINVTRTATATYADPIQLGAPDHMLGFGPYPTRAIPQGNCSVNTVYPCAAPYSYSHAQAFYLELRGPYTGLEHGDAFSPYFATQSGDKLMTTGSTSVPTNLDPSSCTSADAGVPYNNICMGTTVTKTITGTYTTTNTYHLQQNPYYNQQNATNQGVKGYNYIVTIPPSGKPVLLKIMDPYDECNGTPPTGKVVGPDGVTQVSTQSIDQCSAGYWNQPSAGNKHWPTALHVNISVPAAHIADNTSNLPVGTTTLANQYTAVLAANGTIFGSDPGSHGWQWFTLGEVTNTSNQTEYVRINIESVQDTVDPAYLNSYGDGGNNFSLGVCKADSTATTAAHIGDPAQPDQWLAAATTGVDSYGTSGAGTQAGVDLGCADPNVAAASDGYGCPNNADGTANVTCYHVSAREAFCLETLGSGAQNAFIPLAQIDQHFANADITVRLFDAGDIGTGNKTPQSGQTQPDQISNSIYILSPTDDPATVTTSEPYSLDIAAPAGSNYSNAGAGRTSSAPFYPNPSWDGQAPGPCNGIDYSASSYPNSDGPLCPSLSTLNAGSGETNGTTVAYTAGGNAFANDVWLGFHIHISANYSPSVTNQWWKVRYNIRQDSTGANPTTPSANDTTTWEVVSGSAPVHLISLGQ